MLNCLKNSSKLCCQNPVFVYKHISKLLDTKHYSIDQRPNTSIFDRNAKKIQKERAAKE